MGPSFSRRYNYEVKYKEIGGRSRRGQMRRKNISNSKQFNVGGGKIHYCLERR